MKKYKVVDLYDGYKDVLGYADNLQEVKNLAKQRCEETDGECQIWYYPLDPSDNKYDFSKRKFLKYC